LSLERIHRAERGYQQTESEYSQIDIDSKSGLWQNAGAGRKSRGPSGRGVGNV
jgi:hypothetical protein